MQNFVYSDEVLWIPKKFFPRYLSEKFQNSIGLKLGKRFSEKPIVVFSNIMYSN